MNNIENVNIENNLIDLSDIKFKITHSALFHNKNDPNQVSPHIHEGFELYLNVSGDVSFLINNRIYPVKKGEIAFSKPNDLHLCIYNKSCIAEHFVLWIKAEKNSQLFSFMNKKNFLPLIVLDETSKENLLNCYEKLFSISKKESDEQKLLQTAYLLQIFRILNTGENILEISHNESIIPEQLRNLLDAIDNNCGKFSTVKTLADYSFVSIATINRWFRKYLHLSTKEYLLTKKLSYAKDLLSKGVSVEEASDSAGFFDSSHFIAVFKKKFKITPYKYKKQINSN